MDTKADSEDARTAATVAPTSTADAGQRLTRILMDAWLHHPSTPVGVWGKPDNVYFSVQRAVEALVAAGVR